MPVRLSLTPRLLVLLSLAWLIQSLLLFVLGVQAGSHWGRADNVPARMPGVQTPLPSVQTPILSKVPDLPASGPPEKRGPP